VLTEKLGHISGSQKRKQNILEWKAVVAKHSRNSGEPHVNKFGVNKPGVPAPLGVIFVFILLINYILKVEFSLGVKSQ